MADRQLENCERAARVEQRRRAWIDGWTEGVIWALAKIEHALRDGRSSRGGRSERHPARCLGTRLPGCRRPRRAAGP